MLKIIDKQRNLVKNYFHISLNTSITRHPRELFDYNISSFSLFTVHFITMLFSHLLHYYKEFVIVI